MILLIDNYDSFTYNLDQYLSMLGERVRVVRNDALSVLAIARLKPRAIVLSPGPGNPDEAGVTLAVIRELGPRIPILGVCLGHQAIGQAFGGRVVRAARPLHGKVSEIRHRKLGVFRKNVPSPFLATRYHSLVVERQSLPRELEITCETSDGVIMGLRHRKYKIEGVQFHPESIMTPEGMAMLENFLRNAGSLGKRKGSR